MSRLSPTYSTSCALVSYYYRVAENRVTYVPFLVDETLQVNGRQQLSPVIKWVA